MISSRIVQKRADIAAILALFLIAVWLQWSGFGSVLQADPQAYVTSGVNLIRHGEFVNAFGMPELWFPPLFPTLIGLLSVGGRLDAFLMGRLISAASSVLLLVLVWRIGNDRLRSRIAGAAAALVLACNPLFQQQGAASLSQPLATACALAAFVFWLRMPEETGPRTSALFGLAIGLGYLVRPEIMLLLPLLALVDLVERRNDLRHVIAQYVAAGALFAVCAAPYVAYLHAHTGQLQLSNKGEVNLAAGRAEYYHMFREYIDPDTLEMRFPEYPITRSSEIGRYLANVQKIGAGYGEIFRLPLGAPVVGFAVIGLIALWRGSERRVAYGLLVQFAYLAVVARYAVAASYLYMTLPAVALLSGYGLVTAVRTVRWTRVIQAALVTACVGWLAVALTEGATRWPRWSVGQTVPDTLLRDAGKQLRDSGITSGTVLAYSATFSSYSGLTRGRLTPNALPTIVAYAGRTYRGPVYLELSTLEREVYDPSVRALLDGKQAPFPVVLDLSDARGRAVVFKVQ